mgnify:CR=1 FL=1
MTLAPAPLFDLRGLPLRAVQASGAVLFGLGLALPWLVHGWHRWQRPQGGSLRPPLVTYRLDAAAGVAPSLALATAEVSAGQLRRVRGARRPAADDGDSAVVSFAEAVAYCNALTRLEMVGVPCYDPATLAPVPACTGYRLPTAQERAATAAPPAPLWLDPGPAPGSDNHNERRPFVIARSLPALAPDPAPPR